MLLKISLFVLGIIACNGQAADPCQNGEHRVLEDDYRNVDKTCLADLSSGKCDDRLLEGWYAFKVQGQYADIPTNVCIMPGACGTRLPMRLLLNGSLPEQRGEEMEAVGCTAFNILDKWDCCVLRSKVIVRSCGDFRVYRLQPTDRCPVSYCAQLRGQVPSSNFGKTKMIRHSEEVDQDSCPAEDLAATPTRFPEDSTTANTTTTATAVSDTETPAAASTTEGLATTTTMAASSEVTSTSSILAESSTVTPGPDVTTDLGPGTSTTPDSADTSSPSSPPGDSSTDASSSVSSVTDDMGLGTSTTASDSEADSTSVSAPGTTSLPSADTTSIAGVDTTSAAGVDITSALGVDTTSAPGVDATSALGADTTSALGVDTTSAAGVDTTSALGVDTTSAPGVDATSAPAADTTSASGVDTTSVSVTVAPSDSATSTVSASDTVTTAASGMSTDSDAASTDLSGSDATTASPGDVTSEVVRTLFTTSVSDVTSVTNATSAGDVTTAGDLQDATATPSATTGTETAAPGNETSSPAPASVSPSAGVSRSDDTSDQTTSASPTSQSDVTSSGEPMQGDTTTSHSSSTRSTDVITDVDMTTVSATTSPATSTSTSAASPVPSVTPTDTTPTPSSTPSSTPTATPTSTPTATPTSTMTPRGMEPITAAPKPRETRLQLVFDVQDKTVTIANFQEELQAAFNRMLNQPQLEPEGWGRFKDYPDSRAANSTLNPEGVIFVSVIVRNQSVPVLAEQLKRFLDNGAAREFLEKDMMLPLVAYCVMGDQCSYYRRPQSARPSVFDRNLTLFVFLIVLAILLLIVLVFGLIYYRYCYRSGRWVNKDVESKETVANGKNKGKAAGSVESPLSDAEIMRDEVAVEKETPLTSNGAMGADVDNSVVPYPDTEDINAQAMADPAKMEDTKL